MKVTPTHDFDLEPKQAIALQKELAGQLSLVGEVRSPRLVAGVDAAFDGDDVLAAAVVWDLEKQRLAEQHALRVPGGFPYVPGLLSFREGPAIIEALRRVRAEVQAVLEAELQRSPRFFFGALVCIFASRPCGSQPWKARRKRLV